MNLLAVFGNPVSHSLSPQIHEIFASQFDVPLRYTRIESPLDGFREAVASFLAEGAIGFNITTPFKFEAYQVADDLSPQASHARAVNTIIREENGLLTGHNTDGLGLVQDIVSNLKWPLAGQRILILGAGNAVSGILEPVLDQSPACIDIVNRTHVRAESLADQYPDKVQAVPINELTGPYDFVISGSSAGLGSTDISVPSGIIGSNTLCYDLIYGQEPTPFVLACRKLGANSVTDGLGMLVEQAALAFEIWFGFQPDTSEVIKKLR